MPKSSEKKLQYLKEYHQLNKEKIHERKRKYHIDNREEILEKAREWKQVNRHKVMERRQTKYNCGCGSSVCIDNKSRHERSVKHQNYINSKE